MSLTTRDMAMEKDSYTISEFCGRNGISRSKYYELVHAGEGPKVFRVGTKPLISREAAEKWRRQMEAKTAMEAKSAAA